MIPLEVLFILWIAVTVTNGIGSSILFKRRRNSLAIATITVTFASGLVLWYYTVVLYLSPSMETALTWSRAAFFVMGMVLLGCSAAGIILNRGKP